MSLGIKRNDINDSTDDHIVLQFLKDFKAVKCLYCFQEDKKFLCQCKNCGYYFCNNFHRKASHIFIHLKQCDHEKVALNPFEEELACEKCRTKDIFELSFKEKKILCNECIKTNGGENTYKKIIEDKKINNDILMCPDVPPAANRFDSYSESLIARINNKILKLKEKEANTISINYKNKNNYCTRYINLLEQEQNDVKKENDEEPFFEYELKFSEDGGYITAEIKIDKKNKKDKKDIPKFQFYQNQLLIVAKTTNLKHTDIAKVINIVKFKDKEIVTIYFGELTKSNYDGKYMIKEKETTENIDRMIKGLEILKDKDNLFNENILKLIIAGELDEEQEKQNKFSNENEYLNKSDLPQKLNIPKFENFQLNKCQENAIKNCFKNKLTLIRGPPGTGKTKVLSALAYHLLKLKKSFNDKIFLGAPSNRAVDNISYYLQKLELPFVRVLSPGKESSEEYDRTNSLDDLISKQIEKEFENKPNLKRFKELREKKLKYGKLKEEDRKKYKEMIKSIEEQILSKTPIIIATINNSADLRIKDYDFSIVILDEATQAIESDCLLPLYHKAQMVVLIGDEKQLGPTVVSLEARTRGLEISLFERLSFYYNGSDFISTLNEQYRMHSSLYEFSNIHFYENQMITHAEIELDKNVKNNFPWPNKEIPTFFYHSEENEKKENKSYYNEKEMYYVYGIVHQLEKSGVNLKDIGIITPYKTQKLKLQFEKFYKEKFDDLRIESVDGFQGMEKEYIIISCVRSNTFGKIGFVHSPKRLNVSLTRAKKGLIIVGNAECFSQKNGIWRDLIQYYQKKKLIVKGQLSKLEPVSDNELNIQEIEEEEDFIDELDIDENKIEKLLNLDKKTSSDLAWGMAPAPAGDDDEEYEEIEDEKIKEDKEEPKNEIIGLDVKNKKGKKRKKSLDEEDGKEESKKGDKKNIIEDENEEENKKGGKKNRKKNEKKKIEDNNEEEVRKDGKKNGKKKENNNRDNLKEEKKNKKNEDKKIKENFRDEENNKDKKSKKKGKK